MKVVHVVESFAGGVFDFLSDLTSGLPQFRHIIIHGKKENTPENFQRYFPSSTMFYHWRSARREINFLNDCRAFFELRAILALIDNVDVIHLHSSKAGFLGRFASRIEGVQDKVIYTPHGVSFLRKDVSKIKVGLFVFLEKLASKLGGQVICCSNSEKNEFLKHNIHADFIYSGINCDMTQGGKRLSDNITIGTSGRITNAKNPLLFNAIAQSFNNNPKVKFIWIGDGELKKLLTSPNIKITGWLSKDEVNSVLREIDVYLSTSLWEGLPLSVLQAMCFGKPLILHSCVGNIDLVEEKRNGFLFRTVNEAVLHIEKFIQKKDELIEMGRYSAELAAIKFSLNKMLEEYRNLYLKVANRIAG